MSWYIFCFLCDVVYLVYFCEGLLLNPSPPGRCRTSLHSDSPGCTQRGDCLPKTRGLSGGVLTFAGKCAFYEGKLPFIAGKWSWLQLYAGKLPLYESTFLFYAGRTHAISCWKLSCIAFLCWKIAILWRNVAILSTFLGRKIGILRWKIVIVWMKSASFAGHLCSYSYFLVGLSWFHPDRNLWMGKPTDVLVEEGATHTI